MWKLKRARIDDKKNIDRIFSDSTPPALTLRSVKRLALQYAEYIRVRGSPVVETKASALSDAPKGRIYGAYKEVQVGGELEDMRDAIKASADECPYCGFGQVEDLDHHLPKAAYKQFSIFSYNLIPSCATCNRIKPRSRPLSQEKYLIHPYLERLPKKRFLRVRISIDNASGAISTEFYIHKTAKMSAVLHERLQNQLDTYKLNARFLNEVNIHLVSHFTAINRCHRDGDADAVKDYLQEAAKDHQKQFGLNDWRTALLTALSNNELFCRGGFKKALGKRAANS